MTDAAIIISALLGAGLGSAVLASFLLSRGAAYDKGMGLEAEDRE